MIRAATSHILSLLPMPTRPRALLRPSPFGFRARTRTYPESRARLRDCSWGGEAGSPTRTRCASTSCTSRNRGRGYNTISAVQAANTQQTFSPMYCVPHESRVGLGEAEKGEREKSRNVSSCRTAGNVKYDCASVDKDKDVALPMWQRYLGIFDRRR